MLCSSRIPSFHMITSPPSSVCVVLRLSVSWERAMMHVIRLVVLAQRVRSVVLGWDIFLLSSTFFRGPFSFFFFISFSLYHFPSMCIHTHSPSHTAAGHVTHLSSSGYLPFSCAYGSSSFSSSFRLTMLFFVTLFYM